MKLSAVTGTDCACAAAVPAINRNELTQCRDFTARHSCLLCCNLLNVRQLPCLVEQRLLGAVQAEQNFKFSAGARRHPVGLLACRSLGAEVNVYRSIGI